MSVVLLWPGVLVCLGVVFACICRINKMRAGRSRWGWLLLYILWAPFAGGICIDLLTERQVDWWACFGVAGVLLHMILTRRLWAHRAPPETERA